MTTLADPIHPADLYTPSLAPGLSGALMPIRALFMDPDAAPGSSAHVEETATSLRMHAGSRHGSTRPLAALAGSMLVIAAASLTLPLLRAAPDPALPFRLGLGMLLVCAGVVLLIVASSSARPITDVEAALGEIRVYVRGFLGRPRLLVVKPFDAPLACAPRAPSAQGASPT